MRVARVQADALLLSWLLLVVVFVVWAGSHHPLFIGVAVVALAVVAVVSVALVALAVSDSWHPSWLVPCGCCSR